MSSASNRAAAGGGGASAAADFDSDGRATVAIGSVSRATGAVPWARRRGVTGNAAVRAVAVAVGAAGERGTPGGRESRWIMGDEAGRVGLRAGRGGGWRAGHARSASSTATRARAARSASSASALARAAAACQAHSSSSSGASAWRSIASSTITAGSRTDTVAGGGAATAGDGGACSTAIPGACSGAHGCAGTMRPSAASVSP